MFSLWQAHLSFILLSFVLLGSLRLTAPWRPWLLPVLALVSFVPINGLSLAAYVRSFTDDLAISTLVLLGWVSLLRLGWCSRCRTGSGCRWCCCSGCWP